MKNIVVIVVDQLSFRALRAYGGPRAFPAIDSLFERATSRSRSGGCGWRSWTPRRCDGRSPRWVTG
ncbi:MAG: hypothetical protein ACOCVK_00530 [bacterium]